MRIIDADALIKEYERQLEENKDNNSLAGIIVKKIIRRIIEDIKEFPTAEGSND